MTKTRTDIHRPSIADPAEYEDVGYVDNHPEQGGAWWAPGYPGDCDFFQGRYEERGGCDHCGHHSLRYVVLFVHKPTNTIIAVGETCASKLSMSSRNAVEAKKEIERQALQRKVDAYRADHPEVSHFLESVYEDAIKINGGFRNFLMDIRHKLIVYGELSERQTEVVENAIEKQKEFEAKRNERKEDEPEPAPVPVTDERMKIVGKILSTKWKPGFRGIETLKMLVMDDRGFKVWGTVPENILEKSLPWYDEDGMYREGTELRGSRIEFVASVKPSDDDETFGFFSRPKKAEVQ